MRRPAHRWGLVDSLVKPLVFSLRSSLVQRASGDGALKTIFDLVKACNPLVTRDSRLISSANTGRPILQGSALSFDGATQYGVSQPLVTNGDTFINIKMWLKPNEPVNDRMFMSLMHSGSDDVRLITNGSQLIDLVLDDGSISTISTTESSTSNTWRYVEIYVADGENWIEFDGVRYSGTNSFNFATLTDGRLGIGARATGGFFTNCLFLDLKLETDSVNEHWDLRNNGLSALTSGTDLTLVGSPVSVTDNTIPVDPANERGFSGRMLFDGVDDYVRTTSFAGLGNTDSFCYDVTIVTSVLVSQYIVATRNDTTGGLSLALNATGNVQVFRANAQQHTSATSVNDGLKHDIRLEYNGDGTGQLIIDGVSEPYTTATTGWADGNDVLIGARGDGVGGALFTFDGIIYNVNINDQASYLGTGNQDSDWLDQIGSNNGIVTGGEYFAALARSDDPSTDVLGNPTQWQGSAYPVRPVERQSNALSFDGTQRAESPALITSSDTFIHASFWLKPNEPTSNRIAFSVSHSGPDDIRLISSSGGNFKLDIDDGTVGTIFTTESQTSNSWRYVEIYVADGDNWIEFDGVRYSGTHSFNFSTITDGRVGFGGRVGGGVIGCICTISNPTINGTRFPLAEGAGSTAYSTDGTNHGTLIGNPTWVLEDGIPSSNLNDGFSKRMWFDGVDDYVRTTSFAGLGNTDSFFYDVTVVTSVLVSQYIVATRNDTTGGLSLALNATGNVQVFRANAQQHTSATSVNDGLKHDIRLEYNGDGTGQLIIDGVSELYTTATTGWTDGNDVLIGARGDGVGGASFTFDGIIYNVNLNDQASYLGTGNTDADWLDQIGSNNGTVTGGETLRIPAAEGSNSLDAVGGTLTNPAVSNGPHNDAETELDFYNIATDGGTTPAIVASGVVLTDYSFGQILLNPMFKRTISSVLEDRHTLFAAVLTGDCLETANEYTI